MRINDLFFLCLGSHSILLIYKKKQEGAILLDVFILIFFN